jgi:hypothetical protein
MNPRTNAIRACIALALLLSASCTYMKMNPPPDADKTFTAGNNSCYLATASNMLAGAGYGNGTTVQARATGIYNQMIMQFGTGPSGWTDVALTWWLSSTNNVWPTNPYTLVTVYGNKSPKNPWSDVNGARFIGNSLRGTDFVGLSISWPVAGSTIGSGGHAITAWGDTSGRSASISANPTTVRLTDSDNETGGDVQQYTYDAFTNPNPSGANEGNGWYVDYDANHPYIKHIITLAPAGTGPGAPVQVVTGSYKIHQTEATAASDLHYHVTTDVDVLTYSTHVDWTDDSERPAITEDTPRRGIQADWTFNKPIPACNWVTITTDFTMRSWNALTYSDVHFTYPDGTVSPTIPNLAWTITTPLVANAEQIPNVTGGYVVASFEVIDPAALPGSQILGEYRLVHQYSYTQNPERHTLALSGPAGTAVRNLRVGHSYGRPDTKALWKFSEWRTTRSDTIALSATPTDVAIDWSGQLPYPQGEDITGRNPRPEKDPNEKR